MYKICVHSSQFIEEAFGTGFIQNLRFAAFWNDMPHDQPRYQVLSAVESKRKGHSPDACCEYLMTGTATDSS